MNCKKCGNAFVRNNWNRVYCSASCRVAFHKDNYIDALSPEQRKMKNVASGAKQRGKLFSLTLADVTFFIHSDCYYCGVPKAWGMDRVDSKGDYTLDNVVPCCVDCNMMKHFISKDAFIEQCKKIAAHHNTPN
jgi:hypothetical protein